MKKILITFITLLQYFYINSQEIHPWIEELSDVYETAALTELKDLQVGGRNYLLNSESLTVKELTGQGASLQIAVDMIEGQTYTLSYQDTDMEVKNGYPQFYIWEYGNWSRVHMLGNITEKARTFRFNLPTGRYTFAVYNHTVPQAGVIHKLKLEKGNIATDWTPALEEMGTKNELKNYLTLAGGTITGRLGIGTANPKHALDVDGTMRAREVKIEIDEGWADFVFDRDYKLPSLREVESHINDFGHLPGIPSEKEVYENGINMAEMTAKLLQKIEELTLYVIRQEKENQELRTRLEIIEDN